MQRWRATFEGWKLPTETTVKGIDGKRHATGGLLLAKYPRGPFEIEIQKRHFLGGEKYVAIILPTLKKLRPRPWNTLIEAQQTINAMFERNVTPWHDVK